MNNQSINLPKTPRLDLVEVFCHHCESSFEIKVAGFDQAKEEKCPVCYQKVCLSPKGGDLNNVKNTK